MFQLIDIFFDMEGEEKNILCYRTVKSGCFCINQ
jgi:hypothetical protein